MKRYLTIRRFAVPLWTLGVSIALGIAWVQAQDDSDAPPADKWAQIRANNEQMLKSLETIEQNLAFVKARSMQGGSAR